jgi:predicted transcriptional regulator
MALKNKKIFGVFFREKPAMMLVTLLNSQREGQEQYASSLAKIVDCTYSHIVKILNEMQKSDLVEFKKDGRLKVLKLTKKGEDVAKAIDGIRNAL